MGGSASLTSIRNTLAANRVRSHSLEIDEAIGPTDNEEGRMDRRDVLLGTTTAAVSLALPAQSQAQAKSLQDRLVGTWASNRLDAGRFDLQAEQRHASASASLLRAIMDEIALIDRADVLVLQYPMWCSAQAARTGQIPQHKGRKLMSPTRSKQTLQSRPEQDGH